MQFNSSENPREKKGSGHSLPQVDDHSKPSRTKTSPTRWGTNQTLRTGATFKTHLARQGVAAPRRVTGSDGADDEDPVASERIAVSEELLPSRRRRRSPSIPKHRGVGEGTETDRRGMQMGAVISYIFGPLPISGSGRCGFRFGKRGLSC
ncbi:hypothetical protein GW17_00038134 [Ensete ventricosum]|nr:hypothetical protein GW17_00038134 [Ensete ventricosum]